jgi:small conductance mechanosensitive channel
MQMDWATISAAMTSAALQIAAGFALYMIGRRISLGGGTQ